jgi:hypothetical protein
MPAVAEARIEVRIDLNELAADAFDHRAHIGTVAILTLSDEETAAPDDVVDLSIGDVVTGLLAEQCDNVEFVPAERDIAAAPACAL